MPGQEESEGGHFQSLRAKERAPTGVILSQQGLTLSGFREASAVDVDAEELISREGWSIEILPALSNH